MIAFTVGTPEANDIPITLEPALAAILGRSTIRLGDLADALAPVLESALTLSYSSEPPQTAGQYWLKTNYTFGPSEENIITIDTYLGELGAWLENGWNRFDDIAREMEADSVEFAGPIPKPLPKVR